MKRYKVIVEREFIIYGSTRADAARKARAHMTTPNEPPAARPIRVTSVERLPPAEKEAHGPSVDIAPARETRT